MNEYFECKVTYEKITENGTTKKVTESCLVDAISFSEAENRFIEEITPYMSGEFSIKAVAKRTISEIFSSDKGEDDKWYKAKVAFVTLNEKTGEEKQSKVNMMVQAADIRVAIKNLDEGMKGTMADYEILSMSETNIMDVYKYKAE